MTQILVTLTGSQEAAGKLLKDKDGKVKRPNTMGNWISSHNEPNQITDVIGMLVIIIKKGDPEQAAEAKEALRQLYRDYPVLEESFLLLYPSPAPLKEEALDTESLLKNTVSTLTLTEGYQLLKDILKKAKRRQGQRNDLFYSEVHKNYSEVSHFLGRADDWIAELLELGSRQAVQCLQKVLKSKNVVLIEAMNRREPDLGPYQVSRLLPCSLEIQIELLKKSKKERNTYFKQLKLTKSKEVKNDPLKQA